MVRKRASLGVALVLLTACTSFAPLPTLVPTSAPTPTAELPTPIPTATPTPTATPIPPATVIIHWPDIVSALRPVSIEVELIPPPDVDVTATISAVVRSPADRDYWQADLLPKEGFLYAAEEPLRLPLEPPEGKWRLLVYVQSDLRVEGQRSLDFRPAPVHVRDLTGVLPAGADIRVPQDFEEVTSMGDQVSGGRAWRYGGGEVLLWWAPGPTEPLLLNNAVVMLETTYGADVPNVAGVEEVEWQGQTAFLFHEEWPGAEGGPGEALVVQGPDFWLYVLRVRALGGEAIPPLLSQVRDTLTFVVGE